jgi:hypothetical protein
MNEKSLIPLNIFQNWEKCFNHKILIEDKSNTEIKMNVFLLINNEYKFFNINSKTTLHIINCKNVLITLEYKINHIIIENSENLEIKINGLISGINILRSKNIICDIGKIPIFNIEFSRSKYCTIRLHDDNINQLINTVNCINIIFELIDKEKNIKKYITNQSLFSDLTHFKFLIINDVKYLNYQTSIGCGNICSIN